MDTSGLPADPDAVLSLLLNQLKEAIELEPKFQPNLILPSKPITSGFRDPYIEDDGNEEITIEDRNGSAYVLRCLKVWYDLPSDVLFIALNLMDRFLTKMNARKKHMACISVSAFHIAAVEMVQQALDAEHLVLISQCKCTGRDLKRMSEVIRSKLDSPPDTQPVTALTFIRIFNLMFHSVACRMGVGNEYNMLVNEEDLLLRLEMVACDVNCASIRQSEVALVLLYMYFDAAVNKQKILLENNNTNKPINTNASEEEKKEEKAVLNVDQLKVMIGLIEFTTDLKKICKIPDDSFFETLESVGAIMNKYNRQEHTPHRQRLEWKVSHRTSRLLRPTDKFTSVLPVIAEHTPTPSPKRMRKGRKYVRLHGHKRR